MIRILELRAHIVQRLKDAAIPRIDDNVFPDRSLKYLPDELPAIGVYTRKTPFQGADRQPRWMQAETQLVVESIVQGEFEGISVADQNSLFTQAIVDALIYPWDSEILDPGEEGSQGPFDGLADDVYLTDVSSDTSTEGGQLMGGEAVTFTIDWQVLLPNLEPPDTFARMGVKILTPEDAHAEALDIEDVDPLDPV